MSIEQQKEYPVLKRVSNAILILVLIAISVNIWVMHGKNSQQWYQLESEQLGRSLVTQASRMLALPMVNNDKETLLAYLSNIEFDSFIKGSAIFDETGKAIKKISDDYSVITQFKASQTKPLVFVEDIVHNGELIGYVKLVLDRNAIIQHHQLYNNTQLIQTMLVIALSLMLGSICTRLFYKLRSRYRFSERENNLK